MIHNQYPGTTQMYQIIQKVATFSCELQEHTYSRTQTIKQAKTNFGYLHNDNLAMYGRPLDYVEGAGQQKQPSHWQKDSNAQ